MAPRFLGASTTTSFVGQHLKSEAIAESESESPASYIIGVVLFSAVFACAFVLTCCQIRGVIRSKAALTLEGRGAASVIALDPPQFSTAPALVGIKRLFDALSGGSQLIVLSRANSLPVAAAVPERPQSTAVRSSTFPLDCRGKRFPGEQPSGQTTSATIVGSPAKRPTSRAPGSGIAITEGVCAVARGEPCAEEDNSLGNWIGSPEWAAARSSRKLRLEAILIGGVYSKPAHSRSKGEDVPMRGGDHARPPHGNVPVPPIPLASPPKLNVLRDDGDSRGKACDACAKIHKELLSTAMEDMAVRKKTFKSLCARVHPDKSAAEDVELATEVFQYLQTQKAWYLLGQASEDQPSNHMPAV